MGSKNSKPCWIASIYKDELQNIWKDYETNERVGKLLHVSDTMALEMEIMSGLINMPVTGIIRWAVRTRLDMLKGQVLERQRRHGMDVHKKCGGCNNMLYVTEARCGICGILQCVDVDTCVDNEEKSPI